MRRFPHGPIVPALMLGFAPVRPAVAQHYKEYRPPSAHHTAGSHERLDGGSKFDDDVFGDVDAPPAVLAPPPPGLEEAPERHYHGPCDKERCDKWGHCWKDC